MGYSNIVDALLPVHIILKIFGLCPYTYIGNNGNGKYEATKWSACYSLASIAVFIGYYVFAAEQHVGVRGAPASEPTGMEVSDKIDMFYVCFYVVELALMMIQNVLKRNVVLDFFEKIKAIDKVCSANGGSVDYKLFRMSSLGYILFVAIEMSILEYLNCAMFLNKRIVKVSNFCWAMCIVSLLIEAFHECYFVILVWALKCRFRLINNLLSSVPTWPPQDQAETVVVARKLHLQLCEAADSLSEAFSFQLLILFASLFLNYTTNLYHCFKEFGKANRYALVTSALWALSKFAKLLAITVSASLTKREADSTVKMVYKENSMLQPELAREMETFGKQTLHWNVNFSACFFNLDMASFFGVVAAAATYITILFQFDSM